mmetsp:Transcript_24777/g.43646  ORF Transcript_24777/g.43646 Transcript_24777/m.43646 type:complete len:529 (+) Transcript_24777:81-1667(+)
MEVRIMLSRVDLLDKFKVMPASTILALKQSIFHQFRISPQDQCLHFSSEQLSDSSVFLAPHQSESGTIDLKLTVIRSYVRYALGFVEAESSEQAKYKVHKEVGSYTAIRKGTELSEDISIRPKDLGKVMIIDRDHEEIVRIIDLDGFILTLIKDSNTTFGEIKAEALKNAAVDQRTIYGVYKGKVVPDNEPIGQIIAKAESRSGGERKRMTSLIVLQRIQVFDFFIRKSKNLFRIKAAQDEKLSAIKHRHSGLITSKTKVKVRGHYIADYEQTLFQLGISPDGEIEVEETGQISLNVLNPFSDTREAFPQEIGTHDKTYALKEIISLKKNLNPCRLELLSNFKRMPDNLTMIEQGITSESKVVIIYDKDYIVINYIYAKIDRTLVVPCDLNETVENFKTNMAVSLACENSSLLHLMFIGKQLTSGSLSDHMVCSGSKLVLVRRPYGLRIFVKSMLSNKVYTFIMKPDSKVIDLKNALAEKAKHLKLQDSKIYQTQHNQMEDHQTLKFYGLQNNHKVFLLGEIADETPH